MRYHRESRNSLVDRCSLRWLLVAVLAVAALETVLADPSYCALPRDEIPQCSVVDELTPEGTNTTFFAVKQEVTNNVTEWQNHYVLKYRYRLENLLRAYNCDTPYGIGTCHGCRDMYRQWLCREVLICSELGERVDDCNGWRKCLRFHVGESVVESEAIGSKARAWEIERCREVARICPWVVQFKCPSS